MSAIIKMSGEVRSDLKEHLRIEVLEPLQQDEQDYMRITLKGSWGTVLCC